MRLTLAQRAQLVTLYSEPQRHYHTLAHVQHCLRELESIPDLEDPDKSIIEMAIWFHDSVYDPRATKGRNEMASSALMYSTFSGYGAGPSAAHAEAIGTSLCLVEELITATINHLIPESESPTTEKLLSLFLDIDLSIFGQSQDEYDAYAANIRKEYHFVPDDVYKAARRQVLISFLGRDKIYFSSYFRSKYEKAARANLSREILTLVPDTTNVVIHDR